jgi:UDP-N-acetylmuramate dehydrogenase
LHLTGECVPVEHVPLAPLSTLGIGGRARWLARAEFAEEVAAAHRWATRRGVPLFVLGGGSNLVIADEGIPGLVLQMTSVGGEFQRRGDAVVADVSAGEPWDRFVEATVLRGLSGVECLSGIPGTVGGTPIQNVGAYGQEVAETIEAVTALDRQAGALVRIPASECAFSYRMSRFKGTDAGRFIVLGVSFVLRRGPATVRYPDLRRQLDAAGIADPTVLDVRNAVLAVRRGKGMVIDPADPDSRSVGSFFMNPIVTAAERDRIAGAAAAPVPSFDAPDGNVKVPAAWLIERAGFAKGTTDGAVGISTKHPLAIVNRGGATARDVLRFAGRIKRGVADRFGVMLRPEPLFVGFDADDPEIELLTSS